MENTALNGTINATKDHEDWKKKKGYGPILVVAVSLALLLSLYAGVDKVVVRKTAKDSKKNPPSTLTTSLVGSGTAQGGSSAYCKKNTGYNCGAVFPPDGDTCGHKGCCCRQEDGTGMKYNTCDSAKGYAYRGCNSCLGYLACFKTNNIEVGDSSCHGKYSCQTVSDSTIDNVSCHGNTACQSVQNSVIHKGSCQGEKTCVGVKNSTIHDYSCNDRFSCRYVKNSIIGKGSCSSADSADGSCAWSENVKIGNNSCNGGGVCYNCKHNVPDNACNQGSTDDMTDGYCNYCG